MRQTLQPLLLAAAVTMAVTACSGKSNLEPPTPLASIAQRLSIDESWSKGSGSGVGKFYLDIKPLVQGSQVFVAGHDGDVRALTLGSGTTEWQADLKQSITAGVNGGVTGAVVGTESGEVVMLSPRTGEVMWRTPLTSQVTALSAEAEGVLVARTGDGYIYGLSALSGSVVWKQLRKTPALSLQSQSEPLVARGAVFVGLDDGKLLMLSIQDGRVLFEKTIAEGRGRTEIDRLVDIDGDPVLDGNIIYTASYQGNVSAIDAARGQQLWSEASSTVKGLAVDSRNLYLADENSVVWGRDKLTGAALWKQDALKYRRLTAPVVFSNHVVVADYEGYVHWLDPESGQLVDRRRADSSGVITAPVVAGNQLLVLGKSGELSVYTQ